MTSLNLLPEEIKNDIALAQKNAKLRQVFFGSIASFFMVSVFFGVLFFFLNTQRTEAQQQKESAQKQINKQEASFKKAKDLYDRMNLITKIQQTETDWIGILVEMGNLTPAHVQIDSITLFNQNGKPRLKISGNASSDKDVVAFKDNLGKSTQFDYVDIESISKGSDPLGLNRDTKSYMMSFDLKVKK